MNERGYTLVEITVVVALILVLAAVSAPHLRAYAVEAHLLGAGRAFKGHFLKARSVATRSGAQTAIRFEEQDGVAVYSIYADRNRNGIRSDEIEAGVDERIGGPFRLDGEAPGVRVGILPGLTEPPPDTGRLDTRDPIRFGRSNMLSFSPLGSATPGTFYLAGEGLQAAVRVTPGSARVRLLISRGKRWVER
jgi:prepilin-type N-terminal cleavage/methylation domain-containing protein